MLSSISWSAYISLIVTATLVYYIVIVLIYFRKDMIVASQKYSHRRNYIHAEQQPAAPSYLELLINQNMTVCDNIRAYLQKATSENIGKEACINELSVIIAKYPMLNDTPFMVSISNFIIKESEYNNITFLPAEEVDALWVKAG